MQKIGIRNVGTVAVICLEGRVSKAETSVLFNAVISLTDVHTVVLDLARVTMIDAGGMGVLLSLRREAHARGMEFKLTNAINRVLRVVEIARLDSVFEITTREAVQTVSRDGEPASPLAICA